MFAFFGLGAQELILLGVFAAAIAVLVFIVIGARAAGGSAGRAADAAGDRIAALEEENHRLRSELDQIRGKRNGPA